MFPKKLCSKCECVAGEGMPGGCGTGRAGTVRQGSPAAGKGQKHLVKELDLESADRCTEAQARPGWVLHSWHSARRTELHPHPHPPASLILLPGGANAKGMKSRCLVFAASRRFPITAPCSWARTTQPEALQPRGQQPEAGRWGKSFPALQ